MDIFYSGISLIALVIGVTQVIKDAGAPTRYIKLVAIALAFLIFGGSKLIEVYPQAKIIFDIIFTGLYGISAIGLYDASKAIARKP